MNWILDPDVSFWASRTMPDLGSVPAPQFLGRPISLAAWVARGWLHTPVPPLTAPLGVSSPENIISCFGGGHWLTGVTLVVSWGTMTRSKRAIIGAGLPTVCAAVSTASAQIIASDPLVANRMINKAWDTLTAVGGPHWTSVMTSKTLHFMTRALGVVDDCPVPLDGAVTINTLWPSFQARVAFLRLHHRIKGPTLPSISRARSFDAYNCYMTAILIWTNRKNEKAKHHWTTTDVETTIFRMNPIIWI